MKSYTMFGGYVLNDRQSTTPEMMEARLQGVIPSGCEEFKYSTSEEVRPAAQEPVGPPPTAAPIPDEQLYYMMKYDPAQVVALIKRLAARP